MSRTFARSTVRFERKREAILDAATELLNQHGVKGLTLADAAAAVGLSTTSVTYYFKRKDELAAACIQRGLAEREAMFDAALAEPTAERRLYALLTQAVDRRRRTVLKEAPPLPQMGELPALSPSVAEGVIHGYMRLFRKARTLFDVPELEWMTRGRKTARTHLMLEQVGWTFRWLGRTEPQDYDQARDRAFDILVGGMAGAGAEWAPFEIASRELAVTTAEPARDAFLLAATRLINARGYRGASVDKISAALNVTKGSFYHHNDAKDDLVAACFDRSVQALRRVQQIAADVAPDDPWRRLSSAAAAIAEFQLSEHGPLLRTSVLEPMPPDLRRPIAERLEGISEGFAGTIAEGTATGRLRAIDPYIGAQMLMAMFNAAVELPYFVPGIKQKAAPAVFARPILMGLFNR